MVNMVRPLLSSFMLQMSPPCVQLGDKKVLPGSLVHSMSMRQPFHTATAASKSSITGPVPPVPSLPPVPPVDG